MNSTKIQRQRNQMVAKKKELTRTSASIKNGAHQNKVKILAPSPGLLEVTTDFFIPLFSVSPQSSSPAVEIRSGIDHGMSCKYMLEQRKNKIDKKAQPLP